MPRSLQGIVRASNMNFDKVAIVGLGCIFPQSPDPESLWSVVANGINTSSEPPPGRWQISVEDAYSPVVPSPDKVCSRRACLIDKIPLDTAGLDLDGEIIAQLDPLFHLALYAGRQAWEDAQTDQIDRSRTGVIIGNIALPTETSSAMAREFLGWTFEEKLLGKPAKREHRTHPLNRYVTGLPGGVLAKALGLGGGSYTLDAACASSLYALKLAADELLAGRADAMLTGGISRPDCLYTQMGFSQLRALSPSGNCSPFDEKGDGLVVGEGAGIFVLKRLQDALDHQDHIYAVVTGAGLSNDLGANLLAPSTEGQLRAMRPAYQRAGWRPSEVQLIECHATGTPVGDAVEFESLRALWEGEDWRAGQCVIGGVKSNVGHALTAAGSAGLVKTLMAMKHRKLPPTANYSKSNSKLGIESSPFAVLQEPHDWETADDKPRRAAVSGFGFGGINAHLLLEEWDNGIKDAGFRIQDSDERSRVKRVQHSDTPIAIVGMDAFFGPWKTLHEFQERVLGAGKDIEPNSPDHWWGAEMSQWFQEEGFTECPFNGYFVEKIPFPLKRFRIPPKELLDMLPQQLLMLLVADRALSDSKWDESHRLETGLFVGLGLDLNTTNFNFRWSLVHRAREWSEQLGLELSESELEEWVDQLRQAAGPALSADGVMGNLGGIVASRIARAFKIGGPCFTISSEETSGTRALEAAVRALQQNELNYAIVGAVDLASDIRSMLGAHAGRRWSEAGKARPFDVQADGTIMGEGAAAVILKRLEDAERDGDRIYSVIKGMGSATGGGVESFVPTASACALAYSRAYENAGVPPESIGYLETNGSGQPDEDATEVASILAFFTQEVSNGNWAGDVPPTPPMVVGSSKADIGHSGAAAALASVVKASLCLHQSVLPPLRHATSSILQDSNTPTLQYTTPRHWLRDRMAGPRRAGVTSFSVDGNCTHLVLEEAERGITGTRNQESNIRYTELPETLFFCSGSDAGEILSSLDDLETLTTEKAIGLEALACHWAQSQPQNGLVRLALVAYSYTQLGKLLKYAKTHLKQTPDKPIRKAPSHPSDIDGRIFFSPEPLSRVGRVAFVYPGFGNHFSGMGRELSIHWPEIFRSQDAETESLRSQLMVDAFWSGRQKVDAESAIFGQVALGSVVTDLIRSYGIEPDAVIGYSLGESAALFGMRVWRQRHEGLKRMRESALFRTEMAGPHNAVRKAWELGDDEEVNWVVGVVNSPAIEVVSVLEQLQVRESRSLGPRAYLLIVNTPNECVIGGDADAVKKLVAELGCQYHGIPDVIATHCEVVQPVAQAYRNLHVFKTHVPEGVSFYSGVRAGAYEVTPESAADAILGPAVDGFDFTKVINAAYEDGVRVFLEIGPGASCSRMIRQILENREHVAISACSPSVEPVLGIKSVVAQAWAEGAPVKLGSLYQSSTPVKLEEEDCLEIRIGGEPFVLPPLPKHKSYIPAPRRASPPQPRKASGTPATERPSVANSGQAPAHPGGLTTVTPQSGGFVPPATPVSPTPRNGNSVSEFRSHPTGSIGDLVNSNAAVAQAHSAYLDFAQQGADAIAHAISHQLQLFEQAASTGQPLPSST
ncbi:MAG: beta-ketoacyl synthase N-terminal-like domain-containing protein, partial [Planctomycetota bacterium]|nr:beta-ketoacyl synthase N-terminal-like domain-containing protein [Planctomycetota bacterium]